MRKPIAPLLFLLAFAACTSNPHQAPEGFTLAEGFDMELFVAEPLIADPVDMEIDENGTLYVVEMHGYPLDVKGSGIIKVLRDTDNDGYPDKSTVFADSLILPTSIMRWKNGLLVTDAPDVFYLEDTNGDDVADIKKSILTGYARSNPQHNLNSPLYGPDNWIYLGHENSVHTVQFEELFGGKGQPIRYTDLEDGPELPLNANGKSTRFKPDTHELEVLSSKTQYGHTFDALGHYFLVSNSQHIYQEIIPQRYLERNPSLMGINPMAFIPEHGNAAQVYPTTAHAEHQLLTDIGVFTSACGITLYQGGLFPQPYDQTSFVAEPVHNLVHVDVLQKDGAAMKATRMFEGKEFLTSTDAWFRPVNFYVGPDGALYVIDYYRKIIEHPEWMGEDVNQSGELYAGVDKGRIYRITPKGANSKATYFQQKPIQAADPLQLAALLSHKNYWHRINAQRLLVDHKPKEAVAPLEKTLESDPYEPARIHALWTLQGMGQLSTAALLKALHTDMPGLTVQALRIAETKSNSDSVANALLALSPQDAEVKFQLLLSLGNLTGKEGEAKRLELLSGESLENPWMQWAALTAKDFNSSAFWERLSHEPSPKYAGLYQRLGALMALQGHKDIIHSLFKKAYQAIGPEKEMLLATLDGAVGAPSTPQSDALKASLSSQLNALINAFIRTSDEREATTWKAAILFALNKETRNLPGMKSLEQLGLDKNAAPAKRAAALDIVSNFPGSTLDFQSLINPAQPTPVQVASLRILGRKKMDDNAFSTFVKSHWPELTPDVRDEAVNLMMANNVRIAQLLEAVANKVISVPAIGWRRSVRLMTNDDPALKKQARSLLDQFQLDQEKTMDKFNGVEALAGEVNRGRAVFEKNCGPCHTVSTKWGKEVGPDLSSIRNQSKHAILTHIVDPNKSIADGYELWTVKLTDGSTNEGLITTEASNSITLKYISGETTVIPRDKIESLVSSSQSAMPVGLGEQINKEEMADLLEFLKNFHQIK